VNWPRTARRPRTPGVPTRSPGCVPRGQECGVARGLLDRLEGLGVSFASRGASLSQRVVLKAERSREVQRLLDALQSHYDAHPEEVREMLRRRQVARC
jgi:hypothetical protein